MKWRNNHMSKEYKQKRVQEAPKADTVVPTQVQEVDDKCPDCDGQGVKNPTDTFVCKTCEGSGKA